MFYQLGDWSATIKNLAFINLTVPLANGLGCLTIDNCYFHFVRDTKYYSGEDLYDHLIGGTCGDAANPRTFNMTNTVIRVENNTDDKLYLVNNFKNGTTVNFKNVILVADSQKVGITTTEFDDLITAGVTTIGLNGAYAGDVSGFNASMWDTTGNHPTFKSYQLVDATNVALAWGRYAAVDGARAENTAAFVGTVAPGVTVTWNKPGDILLAKDGNKNYIYWNSYKTTLKGSDGKYYVVKIRIADVAINTAEDLKNMITALGANSSSTAVGSGQTVMLNGDIDMEGVTGIKHIQNPWESVSSWGFMGTFDGNGYTISNLGTYLFMIVHSSATIKNVTFKDIKSGGRVSRYNVGANLQNVKFDIDATGMTEVYMYSTATDAKMGLSMTDCEINVKNVAPGTKIYFEGGLKTSADSKIILTNVKVVTDGGDFYWAKTNAITTYDRAGAVDETFNGTITNPVA
jgi:hypothetical protein